MRHTQSVRFSSMGETVWCGVQDGQLQQLDALTGATVDTLVAVERVFDSAHSNLLLLDTRTGGFVVKGPRDLRIPKLTFGLLDAVFSPDQLCLSEAGGPVRCLEAESGAERWRYEPPKTSHVLRLGYRPVDRCFYGVQWEYQRGTSRVVFRFAGEDGQYEEIRQLRSDNLQLCSWEEEFCIDGDALVTSTGEVISVRDGNVINRLAFPQTEYPDGPMTV
jgi:outer membrane protein assembly factor BamB